jgi:hypothetical protein
LAEGVGLIATATCLASLGSNKSSSHRKVSSLACGKAGGGGGIDRHGDLSRFARLEQVLIPPEGFKCMLPTDPRDFINDSRDFSISTGAL